MMQASQRNPGRFFIMNNQESISPKVLVQDKLVAIQGCEGSFHQIAAQKFLGKEVSLAMCDSFTELFRQLDQENATLGIMAIENSVAGSILPNYALLRNSNYQIIGEIYLRISHHLMALKGHKIEDIQSVHSHPMALEQCQRFLSQHRHMKVIRDSDTAGSAKRIAPKPNHRRYCAVPVGPPAAYSVSPGSVRLARRGGPNNFTGAARLGVFEDQTG